MTRVLVFLVMLFCTITYPAHARVNVFACEPEWASLLVELAGKHATVFTATTAFQDPHHIQARPSLIAKARRTDLLVCTGAQLEAGWLPVLLRRAANNRIQPGRPGYFEAADYVTMLDIPARLDRAEGDIHPKGNPHIHTDPRNIIRVAEALVARLIKLDSANKPYYEQQYADFKDRWQAATQRWQKMAVPLRGMSIVTQHKSWVYLNHWLGLNEIATLEPKPGIQPSSTYLSRVLAQLEQTPTNFVVRAAYQDPRPSEWLARRTNIPVVILPYTVGGSPGATDLTGLFDDTLRRLLEAIQ